MMWDKVENRKKMENKRFCWKKEESVGRKSEEGNECFWCVRGDCHASAMIY